MERPLLSLIELIAPAVFYVAFVLTSKPIRSRLAAAAILYAIGMMIYPSVYLYSAFSQGTLTNGGVPLFERLWPLFFLCFAMAAAILLWPAIPKEIGFKCGVALFCLIAPVVVFLRMLSYHNRFHHYTWGLDLTWVVYALLWFRIHERYGKEEVSC